MSEIRWITHPRFIPKPPKGRVVVVDVAFAAGTQFTSKTLPLIDGLGPRLVRWVDHHEHRVAWPKYENDPRFLLVPNKIAHACPELITPELVRIAESEGGPVDVILAHCDFDGAVAAAKWRLRGEEPWPGADEDARAVDSPGRGHTLSSRGERFALAMDEATATFDREARKTLMSSIVDVFITGEESLGLGETIDTLAFAARRALLEAEEVAATAGSEEAPGVFVVRVDRPSDNRMRRSLLMAAEERAPIGVLYEPDKEGVFWLVAATFDERLDLEEVEGFEGGRSDYRFARAHEGGHERVRALSSYLASALATSDAVTATKP